MFKGYFEAFIRAYEPVLQSRTERFVARYDLSADDTEDIKQIFLETLWFAFLGYDAADPIPLLQYVKKAAVQRQLDYIRTTKNACTVPTQNGYNELRKVMGIYNSNPEIPTDERIALIVKETGFTEEKVTEFIAIGKACEYPVGIVPTEENENAADGTVSDELIEDPSVSLFGEVLRSIYRAYFRDAADRIIGTLCRLLVSTVLSTGLTSLFSLIYISQIFAYVPALVAPALVILLVTVVFSVISSLVQMKLSEQQMELSGKESGMIYSLITGIQKIRLAGADKRAFARWGKRLCQ